MKSKISLIFTLFILYFGKTIAQPFGANGATWHYNYSSWTPPYSTFPVVVNSSQPFMIGNDTCRTIDFSGPGSGCSSMSSFIVTQRNDSVLYFSPFHNDFVLLYNYNAVVGDTQTIYASGAGYDTSVQLLVTNTGSITINGHLKRTYTTSPLTYYYSFGGMVIEDIGSTTSPFPQFGFCDPLLGGIRCYEDSIVGLYNFNPAIACDSSWTVGLNEVNENDGMLIYPNPFNSYLTIFNISPSSESDIIIRDPLGREIKSLHFGAVSNQNSFSIDLNEINNGIYFMEIIQEKSQWVRKIIKE